MQNDSLNLPLLAALVRHYDELVGYVHRKFGDRAFARDIVHDVYVELTERPPTAIVRAPLAFLRRASTNQAIDRSRSDDARSAWIESVADVPDIHVHEFDGACALDFAQQLDHLRLIIEKLPARARQIFLLHRLHDMPQEEIAKELGISRNMVTQHFSRAMNTIESDWEPARQLFASRFHKKNRSKKSVGLKQN